MPRNKTRTPPRGVRTIYRLRGGVAHDGEEEEHFQPVDEDEDGEEDVEAGQGKIGELPEQGVGEERNSQHFGGEEKKNRGFSSRYFG